MKKTTSAGSINKPKSSDHSPVTTTGASIGKVELVFDPRAHNASPPPASTDKTTTDVDPKPAQDNTNDKPAVIEQGPIAQDNNNSNNATPSVSPSTTPPTTTKVVMPFKISELPKEKVALINLAHYLAYGKPLFDGSNTYNSYVYGVGKTTGWVFGRTRFDGFKTEFNDRFKLFHEAQDAIMAINIAEFNNQHARNKLNDQLKAIFARSSGTRYVQCMKEWMDSYHEVYQHDHKAKAWVESNQEMLSADILNDTHNVEPINDAVDIQPLIAFNIRDQSSKIPRSLPEKMSAFIRGNLRPTVLDTYVYHNIDPNFTPQLSFDGKHNTQKEMPKPNDYALAYMTYKSHEVLRRPTVAGIISHLFMCQNLHHKVNQQVSKPATFVEIDLQSSIIKAILLHRDPKLLRRQVQESLKTVFERAEDRKAYHLDDKKYAAEATLFDSLQKARVPQKLLDALNFFLGNCDLNDCKNSDQAIQAVLESSRNISEQLKTRFKTNKPETFDENLATEFLDSIAAFTKEPHVVQAMNQWMNPDYVAPTPASAAATDEEKKIPANSSTQLTM